MKQKIKLAIFFGIEFIAVAVILILVFFAGKKSYTVTFDLNGGTLLSGDLVQEVIQGGSATPPVVAKDGCFLHSWSTYYTKVTKDITVRAIWEYETTAGIDYSSSEDSNYCEIVGAFGDLLLADLDLAGELELLPDADRVVLHVVEALDRVDRDVVLLGDLGEVVAALHDVDSVLGLDGSRRRRCDGRRDEGLHVVLHDHALAVGGAACARKLVLCSGSALALRCLRHGNALAVSRSASARTDVRGSGRALAPCFGHDFGRASSVLCLVIRGPAIPVGILAPRDRSDRGESENHAELVHFLFTLL